jgi:Rps23 Pro-64 3,4-dihydroxylase Tpa1-like proline 4-hydroxylase
MEITKYKEDVFHVSNVISKEEADKVIKYLEFLADSNILKWNQISFYDSYAMGFWDSDPRLIMFGLPADFFSQLKYKIKNISEKVLGKELSEVSYHAQKWIEGAFASFHSDNSDDEGNPTAFERSKYAVFMYLNDDFTGGVLNFKNHDITIRPELGMLAIFSGGHGNEHEVTKVKSGTRYTIGSFWDNADSVYTEEQRKKWDEELSEVRKQQEEEYKVWAENKEKGISLDYVGKNGE